MNRINNLLSRELLTSPKKYSSNNPYIINKVKTLKSNKPSTLSVLVIYLILLP